MKKILALFSVSMLIASTNSLAQSFWSSSSISTATTGTCDVGGNLHVGGGLLDMSMSGDPSFRSIIGNSPNYGLTLNANTGYDGGRIELYGENSSTRPGEIFHCSKSFGASSAVGHHFYNYDGTNFNQLMLIYNNGNVKINQGGLYVTGGLLDLTIPGDCCFRSITGGSSTQGLAINANTGWDGGRIELYGENSSTRPGEIFHCSKSFGASSSVGHHFYNYDGTNFNQLMLIYNNGNVKINQGGLYVTGGLLDLTMPGDPGFRSITGGSSNNGLVLNANTGWDGGRIEMYGENNGTRPGEIFHCSKSMGPSSAVGHHFYNYDGTNFNQIMLLYNNGNVDIRYDAKVGRDLTVEDDAIVRNTLQVDNIPTSTDDYLLICGENGGVIKKRTVSSLPSGADDLGNHTAAMTLDMNYKNIVNAANILGASLSVGTGGIAGGAITGTSLNLGSGGAITSGAVNCASLNANVGAITTTGAISGGSLNLMSGAINCGNITSIGQMEGVGLKITGTVTGSSTVSARFSKDIEATEFIDVSDERFKKNVQNLEKDKEYLFQLNPYQYNFKKGSSNFHVFDDKLHFGFLAQDVKQLYPNLTSIIDEEGHLGINYTGFIPLLLQALKEEDVIIKKQAKKITDLESKIALLEDKMNSIAAAKQIFTDGGNMSISTLDQNIPNPFSKETSIGYNIVGDYNRAYIGIYDLNGREVRKVEIQKDTKQVIVPAGTLSSGMYVYSLLVDNKLIDTKKMVVE